MQCFIRVVTVCPRGPKYTDKSVAGFAPSQREVSAQLSPSVRTTVCPYRGGCPGQRTARGQTWTAAPRWPAPRRSRNKTHWLRL